VFILFLFASPGDFTLPALLKMSGLAMGRGKKFKCEQAPPGIEGLVAFELAKSRRAWRICQSGVTSVLKRRMNVATANKIIRTRTRQIMPEIR
jgi:hypothetical protein